MYRERERGRLVPPESASPSWPEMADFDVDVEMKTIWVTEISQIQHL